MERFKYKKLRGMLLMEFITLKASAEALGIATTTLRSKLIGKREFTKKELTRLKEMLKLTNEELIEIIDL